jgi:hypothetical protein
LRGCDYVATRVVESGDFCRRFQSLAALPALKYDTNHGSPTAKAVGDYHNMSSFSSLVATRKSARRIPKNARNALTGAQISYNKPVLNFNGEYATGRYYQNSAASVLETRRNPRTQQYITDAYWFTPKRGGGCGCGCGCGNRGKKCVQKRPKTPSARV